MDGAIINCESSSCSIIGTNSSFAAKIIDIGKPGLSFGFGPQFTLPTAKDDVLGSEKWSGGFANVLFDARSPVFQYGYLLTWQHSFAGDDDRDDVNFGAFQPFYFYQLGGGTYLRGAPIATYNFENDDYTVPVSLGIGQVFRKGSTVYNVFIEPQYSVWDDGEGLPEWQIFFGLNLQFK